jgi:hypothetical protein
VLLGRLVTFDPARPEVEDGALYIGADERIAAVRSRTDPAPAASSRPGGWRRRAASKRRADGSPLRPVTGRSRSAQTSPLPPHSEEKRAPEVPARYPGEGSAGPRAQPARPGT